MLTDVTTNLIGRECSFSHDGRAVAGTVAGIFAGGASPNVWVIVEHGGKLSLCVCDRVTLRAVEPPEPVNVRRPDWKPGDR